jgi:hypothetical protein
MTKPHLYRLWRSLSLASIALAGATAAVAGDRLLATGGVSQLEGAAGGGLVPWAVIAGYGTRDQVGVTAFHTNVDISDFSLTSSGAAVGIYDRLELSLSRQRLGLGTTVPGKAIDQDIVGVKLKLSGDAVYDQDKWMPQLSAGLQYKRNRDMAVPTALGARSGRGIDAYLSATKLYLAAFAGRNVLVNVTVRATKANQLGLLGFGGDKRDRYQLVAEPSVALLLNDGLAIGAEYRHKPDNLSTFREDDFSDAFVAWFLNKNLSLTLAHARLGQVADKKNQRGTYLSLQGAF